MSVYRQGRFRDFQIMGGEKCYVRAVPYSRGQGLATAVEYLGFSRLSLMLSEPEYETEYKRYIKYRGGRLLRPTGIRHCINMILMCDGIMSDMYLLLIHSFIYLCIYIFMNIYLFIYLFIYMFVCLFIYLFICLFIFWFKKIYIYLLNCLFVYVFFSSVYLFIYLFIYVFILLWFTCSI